MSLQLQEEEKIIYRRLAYILVAIIASVVMFFKPVFGFQEDKGIMYIRHYRMTQTEFTVTQTEIDTGVPHPAAKCSVMGLLVCNIGMLACSIWCLLSFFDRQKMLRAGVYTMICAGAYYVAMIYYAVLFVDMYFATAYPTFMVVFPAVVLEMMLLIRRNVQQESIEENEEEQPD